MSDRLKSGDFAFVRVRLMTKHTETGREEWVCAQVGPSGRDLHDCAGVVWAEEGAIVTVKEAREIIKGAKR